MRSTRDVIESHLELRLEGDLDEDLRRNYHEHVQLLSAEGVSSGHDGVRRLAAILKSYVDVGNYAYDQVLVAGEVGMLQWHGRGGERVAHDGADSYVVRDGLITAQTIHYSTRPARE